MGEKRPKHSSEPPLGEETSGARPAARADERRRADRWPSDAEIEILSPIQQIASAIDVSRNGIQISLEQYLSAGTICDLRIQTHTGRVLYKRARVLWTRREGARCVSGLEVVGSLAPPTGEQD